MAFSVSYIYEITDRYTAPLQKITRATTAFTRAAKRAEDQVCKLGKRIDTTGGQATRFNQVIGHQGTGLAMKRLIGPSVRLEQTLRTVGTTSQRTRARLQTLGNTAVATTNRIAQGVSIANGQLGGFAGGGGGPARAGNAIFRLGQRVRGVSGAFTDFSGTAGALGAGFVLQRLFSTSLSFQEALNRTRAVTGATTKEMRLMSKQAKDLGLKTEFSAVQVASAMSFLGMAGLETSQIMDTIPGLLNFAAAGALDLSQAADIATNILQAFQLPLSQIGHLSDVLAKAASKANTSVFQLAGAMRNVAPTAALAGVGVEETTAAIMALANAGIHGQAAGTFLMNSIRALSAMTPKAAKTLAKLGIDPRKLKDSEGKIKNFTGLIDELGKRGATAQDLFNIFSIQGTKAMGILVATGAPKLKEFTQIVTDSQGAAEKMASTLLEGAPGAVKRFKSAFEGIQLFMAGALMPIFTRVLETLKDFFINLENNNPRLLKFASYALVVTAGVTLLILPLSLLTAAFGSLLTVLGLITWPVTLVIGGVFLLVKAFRHWLDTSHPIINALGRLKDALSPLFTAITKGVPLLLEFIGVTTKGSGEITFLSAAFDALGLIALPVISVLTAGLRLILNGVVAVAQAISGDFTGAWKTLSNAAQGSLDDLKQIVDTAGTFEFAGAGPDLGNIGRRPAAATAENQAAAAYIRAGGRIVVEAAAGTRVTQTEINLNQGANLATTE